MKTAEKKMEFIRLRANHLSYSKIAEQLHISKSTCTAWAEELEAEVAELEGEQLQELYTQYGMYKAERIRQLGDSLHRINEALSEADLSQVSPEKLLRLKLEYATALRNEYPSTNMVMESGDSETILQAYIDLLKRVQDGTATEAQAKAEMALIDKIKHAQKQVENDSLWGGLFNLNRGQEDEEEEYTEDEEYTEEEYSEDGEEE